MVDQATVVLAVATISSVGFTFHTAIPAISAIGQRAKPLSQAELLGHFKDKTVDVGAYVPTVLTSTLWLYFMLGLSALYLISALGDLLYMLPSSLTISLYAAAPSSLSISTGLLVVAVGATLIGWLLILIAARMKFASDLREAVTTQLGQNPIVSAPVPQQGQPSVTLQTDTSQVLNSPSQAVPPQPSPPPLLAVPVQANQKNFCRICGSKREADANYCEGCGSKHPSQPTQNTPTHGVPDGTTQVPPPTSPHLSGPISKPPAS